KKKFIFSIILILLCSCNFSKEESCFKCKKIFEGSDITYWASAAYEDHGTEQGCFEHIEITSEDISEHELFFPDFNIDVEGKGFKTYECHMGDEQKLIWKEIPNSCWICLNPNIENELGQEFEFASESDIDGSCRLWTSNDKEDYLFLDESYLTIANTKCKKETNGGLSWDYIPNSCWICPDNLGNQMFPSDINIDFSCRLWSEEDDKYYYLKEYNIKKHCVIKDQKFHWENPLMTYATSQKRTEDPFNFYYFNWDNRCWLCEKEMDDGKSKLFAVNYENQWDDQGCQNYRRLDLTELYTRGTTYIDYYTNWLYGLGTPKCKITVENGKIKANWDDRHWNNCLICKNEEEYIAVSGNDYYKDCTYWSSIDAEQYPDDDGKIRTCIETEGYMEWKDPIIDIKDVFVEKTSEFNIFEEEDICANFEDKIQEKQGKKVGLTKDLFEEGTSTDAKENNPCNECTDKGSHFISKYSERSLDGTNACCPNFFDYVKEGKCSSDYYENLLDCDFTKGLECTSMDEKTILPSEQKAYFNPKKRSVFFNKDSYLRYDLERELYVESGVVEIEFIPRWDSNQHLQGAKRILHIPLKEGNFEVIRYIEPKIESGWMTSNPVPSSLLFDKIVPHAISGNVWKRNDKVNLVIEWGDFGTRTYVNGKFLNTYGEKPNIKTSDNGIIFIGNGGLNPLEYITGGEEEYIKVRLISSNINSFVYDLDDRKDMIENNDPIIIKGSGEKRLRDILGGKIDGSTKMVGFESTGIILESDDTDEPLILDCEDLTLAGDFRSNGIEIIGTDNVIIRNCIIKNFRWGVYIGQASKITIEDNSISDNYDDASAIACFSLFDNPYYYDWRPVCGPWTKYGEEFDVNSGGGIYMKDSYDVIVDNNYLQNQGVGITMISSHKCNILHNYADHNSGYGIHLVKSNNNYIFNNDFSYTNRFCGAAGPSQKGGCDSAAIMLEYNSNNNRFTRKSLRDEFMDC
ncbi:MAG: right-handed parallel beta-helix repeat-containing protein, partial [Nanoarchaeota archaeon]|nr:right-handed parallel beta-helix repeat-containing protein [Nanoarchaeota archaeon]